MSLCPVSLTLPSDISVVHVSLRCNACTAAISQGQILYRVVHLEYCSGVSEDNSHIFEGMRHESRSRCMLSSVSGRQQTDLIKQVSDTGCSHTDKHLHKLGCIE